MCHCVCLRLMLSVWAAYEAKSVHVTADAHRATWEGWRVPRRRRPGRPPSRRRRERRRTAAAAPPRRSPRPCGTAPAPDAHPPTPPPPLAHTIFLFGPVFSPLSVLRKFLFFKDLSQRSPQQTRTLGSKTKVQGPSNAAGHRMQELYF